MRKKKRSEEVNSKVGSFVSPVMNSTCESRVYVRVSEAAGRSGLRESRQRGDKFSAVAVTK